MENDVLGFAEQNVEENIEAMEFAESTGEIGDLFHDATTMMAENAEIKDAKQILDSLNLNECTLIEMRMHEKSLREEYELLNDLKSLANSAIKNIINGDTDSDLAQAIAEANAEIELEGGERIDGDLMSTHIKNIEIQADQYNQVLEVLKHRIAEKELEVDTPSKSRDDVRIASERLLAKYDQASIENKQQRKILEKMVDAYNENNDYGYLFNHANQEWTHIKYAKKAILELVRKKEHVDTIMFPLIKELRIRTSTVKTEGNWKIICDMVWEEVSKICINEDADFAFPDKYKEVVGQILMYTALSDWVALLRSSRVKGNGAYVRVLFSNMIDTSRGVSDIITLEEVKDIVNGLLKIYLSNIIPYLPRKLVHIPTVKH